MELLYFYALAHQTAFDVRWLKKGSVQSTLVAPFAEALTATGHVSIQGGSYVERLVEYNPALEVFRRTNQLVTIGTTGCGLSTTSMREHVHPWLSSSNDPKVISSPPRKLRSHTVSSWL